MLKMRVTISNDERFIEIHPESDEIFERLEKDEDFKKMTPQKARSGVFVVDTKYLYELNSMFVSRQDMKPTTDRAFKSWVKYQNIQKPVILKVGVVDTYIEPNGNKIPHKKIEVATRFFVKGAEHSQAFKSKKWDGYINMYKRWKRSFKTGLINKVVRVLEKEGLKYTFLFEYDKKPDKVFDWKAEYPFTLTEDQEEAIGAAVNKRRGIVKCPTGFGKTSAVAAGVVAANGVPTLFIANRKTLLDDARDDFLEVITGLDESDITQIKDGWFGDVKIGSDTTAKDVLEGLGGSRIKHKVIVATVQSIKSRLDDKRTSSIMKDWLNNVCKCVVIDETQAVGSKVWDEVLDQCHAPLRIAMSATPKRNDGATIKIEAYSGPWLYSTTAAEQIEKGRLCELDIRYNIFDHKLYNEKDRGLEYAEMYQLCIVENERRNKECIVDPCMEMLEEERFVLVLVQYIEHGHRLKEMLIEAGVDADRVAFIWGDTPDKVRREYIQRFRRGEIDVMIGSTIFDVGLNVPVVSGVIMAGAGNSEITLIQRIGRGARNSDYEKLIGYTPKFIKENGGEKVTKVVDVYDVNAKFFRKQSQARMKNAKEEFGDNRVSIVGDKNLLKTRRPRRKTKQDSVNEAKLNQLEAQLSMMAKFVD